jgi:uncharacterized protein YaiL (DUF2058 family)
MSDLRDQLRKAGLISDKQARQAKHKERVHADEVGREGLAEEKRREQEQRRGERQEKKQADRRREKDRLHKQRSETSDQRIQQVIRSGWIRDATIGSRRFFFPTRTGRITYLDLSEPATRKLLTGKAAIVETMGSVYGAFCVVSDKDATLIKQLDRDLIRFWNEEPSHR